MAVAVVQETAATSTAVNPTLKYPSRPAAGNLLLAYCMQEAVAMPGTPTDSAGNPWQMIACEQRQPDSHAPTGLSVCVFRVPSARNAATTVTFPTTTDSLYAIQEFSGVAADTVDPDGDPLIQPDYVSAGFAGPGSDFYIGVAAQNPSDYCQALIVCLDQTVTWSLDSSGQFAGWTVDRTFAGGAGGNRVGMSGVLCHQVASSFVLAHLIANKPTVACVLGISLSHS